MASTRKIVGASGVELEVDPSGNLSVGTPGGPKYLTISLDTSAYAAGDVLFDFQEVADAARESGGSVLIQSITVVDADDQKAAMDIKVASAAVSLGTENGVPDISDADAATVQHLYSITASDYKDMGGVSHATIGNLGIVVGAAAGSTSIYIGGITQGTPTHTASGLKLIIGLIGY